jgi:hypothetical protein
VRCSRLRGRRRGAKSKGGGSKGRANASKGERGKSIDAPGSSDEAVVHASLVEMYSPEWVALMIAAGVTPCPSLSVMHFLF